MNRTKEAVAASKTLGPAALDVLSKRKQKRLRRKADRKVIRALNRTKKAARVAANRQKRAEEAAKTARKQAEKDAKKAKERGFTPPKAPARPQRGGKIASFVDAAMTVIAATSGERGR